MALAGQPAPQYCGESHLWRDTHQWPVGAHSSPLHLTVGRTHQLLFHLPVFNFSLAKMRRLHRFEDDILVLKICTNPTIKSEMINISQQFQMEYPGNPSLKVQEGCLVRQRSWNLQYLNGQMQHNAWLYKKMAWNAERDEKNWNTVNLVVKSSPPSTSEVMNTRLS